MKYIILDAGKEYLCNRDQVVHILAVCKAKGGKVVRHACPGTIRRDFARTLQASYFTVQIGKGSADIFKAI